MSVKKLKSLVYPILLLCWFQMFISYFLALLDNNEKVVGMEMEMENIHRSLIFLFF
jgi:hypothetical protein